MNIKPEITLSEIQELQKYLVSIRHSLVPQGNQQTQIAQSLNEILKFLPTLHDKVYRTFCFHSIESQNQNAVFLSNLKQNKISLYYFQLLNLIVINLKQQKHTLNDIGVETIHSIFKQFVLLQAQLYHKAFKAFLIFYFNLLRKLSPQFVQQTDSTIIFSLLSCILNCYFKSHFEQNLQKDAKFKEQTEWMGYIFELLPKIQWKTIDTKFSPSFLRNYFKFVTCQKSERRKSQYNIIHMLGNYLQLAIESRTTTEIVHEYECQIQDINEMYSNPNKDKLCNIKLKLDDAMFVCELLTQYYNKQKSLFQQIFRNSQQTLQRASSFPDELISTVSYSQEQVFNSKFKQFFFNHENEITVGQLLLETMNVLNSILFLGGYNSKLQLLIYNKLFENNILPEFLELSYLIYNERRFMGKHSIKLSMAKSPDANLSKILQIDYESIPKEQRIAIYKLVSVEIKFGQLSTLLRLMTNLIHINNSALNFFQNNTKYLHMVMSLTHQSQINLTMKNWAVLFIKNCCDSLKLRQQIQSIKVQMKVQE